MGDRRPVRGGFGPFAIKVVLQDGVDGGVGAGADLQRPRAGGLQPVVAMCLCEADDPKAGAKALFRMGTLAQDHLNEGGGVGANPACLAPDPLRRPVGMSPVARRHMLTHGGVLAVRRSAGVRRNPLALMENLDRALGEADPDLLAQERMWHRVVVTLDLHMVVEPDGALLPFGEDVSFLRQRLERRAFKFLEQGAAALLQDVTS